MVKFEELDIISGLEEAFFRIWQLNDKATALAMYAKKTSPARKNFSRVGSRSYFVQLQSLYNSFTSLRRSAWDAYWNTLPFGSHAGANGYPGSGYSAFIYINAPLWKAGDDLILDPPLVTNMLINGTFDGTLDPWATGDGWLFGDDFVYINPGDWGGVPLYQYVDGGTDGVSYKIKYDVRLNARNFEDTGPCSAIVSPDFGDNSDGDNVIDLQPYADGDWHTVEQDITCHDSGSDPTQVIFRLQGYFFDVLDGTTVDVDNFILTPNP